MSKQEEELSNNKVEKPDANRETVQFYEDYLKLGATEMSIEQAKKSITYLDSLLNHFEKNDDVIERVKQYATLLQIFCEAIKILRQQNILNLPCSLTEINKISGEVREPKLVQQHICEKIWKAVHIVSGMYYACERKPSSPNFFSQSIIDSEVKKLIDRFRDAYRVVENDPRFPTENKSAIITLR